MGTTRLLSSQIRLIGKDRMEADHKITDSTVEESNFVKEFIAACNDFVSAINGFEYRVRQLELT